jgi:hypothetical protein
MAVLRNGSKCSNTTCMLRFFTISRLALNPNLIFEIGSIVSIHKWPFLSCSAFSEGFRLRRTGVGLTANPCATLIRTKTAHF